MSISVSVPAVSGSSAWRRAVMVGAVVACAVVLSGCASTFAARVTTFQQWPSDAVGSTYRLAQPEGAQAPVNLEAQAYDDMVRAAIGTTGLVEARAGTAPARFTVSYAVSSSPYQTWADTPAYYTPPPVFFFGNSGRRFGYGFAYPGPWGWGYQQGWQSVPVTAFKHTLTLWINDAQRHGAEVYRASAEHNDQNPSVTQVVPYLVQTVFEGFPQGNGTVRTVEVPVPR
jgi:hypothetical protein